MRRGEDVRRERTGNTFFQQQWKRLWRIQMLALLAFMFGSCNLIDLDVHGYIDPELQPYVDSFVEEAAKRRISINTQHLTMTFKELKNKNGITYLTTKKIYIDPASRGWINEPERVVFHELSHLYLHRNHDDSTIGENNNYPKSIMTNDGGPYYRIYSFRREYYVNELFDPNTPAPIWCNN